MPTPWCRCRCIGAGNGRGGSTSRRCSPRSSPRPAAGRSPTGRSSAVKATPQQVGLAQAARALNVQGAFRVPADGKAEVAGRRLVLVDDVLTSGATVGRLRPGAAAGRRCAGGRAGLRPGCGGGPHSHITSWKCRERTCPRSRSTPPATAPIASPPSGCCRARASIHRDRRQRRSGRAQQDGRRARAAHDRAADLHRRDPCRRLRRSACARPRRQARPAARRMSR